MDLSQLSDSDLQALQAGNLSGVSDAGLQLLAGQQGAPPSGASTNNPTPSFGGAQPINPATSFGGAPLEVYNPFGKNLDTGINMPTGVQNFVAGIGKLYTDASLGTRQMYAQVTGGNPSAVVDPVTGQTAAEKRTTDAPLMGTTAGKLGVVGGSAPLFAIPGANSYAGAALIGAGTGALRPTVAGESRALNTGIGAGIGLAGKWAGDKVAGWLTQRAQSPFMGWNPGTANRIAAQSIGSDASSLNQNALGAANDRFSAIFNAARNPNATAQLGTDTAQTVYGAASGLNRSSADALGANPDVSDLMAYLRSGSANAQQLGSISSNLGREAAAQMGTKGGDRALGQALFAIKDHVDNLVGSTITDPQLAADYAAALPQYRNYLNLTSRPSILNSATGDVNFTNLGKYLQRADKPGYMRGGNQTPLYQAARWGQATGEGAGAPPILSKPISWAAYRAVNNPVAGAIGGTVSRTGAPFAPALRVGLPALAVSGQPVFLSDPDFR